MLLSYDQVLYCTRINADSEDAQLCHGVVEGLSMVLGKREQELRKVEQAR